MDNLLYRAVLVPMRESADGETPTTINVTKEVNGYALLHESADGLMCLGFCSWSQHELIERAVDMKREEERSRAAAALKAAEKSHPEERPGHIDGALSQIEDVYLSAGTR